MLNAQIVKINIKEKARTHNIVYKTSGSQCVIEHFSSYQKFLYLDSEVAPKSPTFHTAIRCAQSSSDSTSNEN
jgi:hypothetical protein